MMIKLFTPLVFLLLVATGSACSKTPESPATTPTLKVSTSSIEFTEKDSVQSILVESNAASYEVRIASGITWCTYEKKGNTLDIKVSAMTSATAKRNTEITISTGSGSERVQKTVTIAQNRVWKLVWEDNFDTDGPISDSRWTLVSKGSSDWNKYMTPSNDLAFVQSGNLILKGRKTTTGYEAGGVNSSGKFSFKYGKVEVRAKLSAGQGTWPAIWLMPQQSVYGGWPKSGEIDIMEHLNNDTKIYQVVHTHYVDNLGNKTDPPYVATPAFNVGAYNTFGMEWFPDRIDFTLNGAVTFTYPKKTGIPQDQLQWPFDQSFYLILNQALGGAWVGSINDLILPVQTEIDYVKVYGLRNY